jgi:hypothetical protein
MPKKALTQLAVTRLKTPGVYWDIHLASFGLRVSSKGKKSWICFYRVNGKQVQETLGSIAQIPTVEEARNKAARRQLDAKDGINAVEERRRIKRDEEQRAREAQERAGAVTKFGGVVKTYLEKRAKKLRPRTAQEMRRVFDKDIVPRWIDRDINTITKTDIRKLRDEIADGRNTEIVADRTVLFLKTLFKWAVAEDYVEIDPTAGVKPLISKPVSRDRVLTFRLREG